MELLELMLSIGIVMMFFKEPVVALSILVLWLLLKFTEKG